jgi:hypothetical protein
MSKKSITLLFVLIIAPMIIYLLWPTEEARIKKLVRQAAHAVEEENIEEVMSKVSYNYQDEYGLSYLLIKKGLQQQFQRYSNLDVDYENLKVEIAEGKGEATASMDLRVVASAGQEMGYVLGGDGPARFVLRLKKGGPLKKWQVVEASGFIQGT